MTRAEQQQVFIADMIEQMNEQGLINGLYVGHRCEVEGLCFLTYSLAKEDRHSPYCPVRMSWDDVTAELARLGFIDAI